MIDIQKNIEAIRKEKGIKQEELARRLNITQGGYSHYVARNLDIPFFRIQLIAEALKVSVVDIITYPETYVPKSSIPTHCEECDKKQQTIDNLNKLIQVYEYKEKHRKAQIPGL